MSANKCVTDLDCIDNELCYANTSWFQRNFIEHRNGSYSAVAGSQGAFNAVAGCACNRFYAWSGDHCVVTTFETHVFTFLFFISAMLAFSAAILSTLSLNKYCEAYDSNHFSYWVKQGKTVQWMTLCNLIGSLGTLCWAYSLISSAYMVDGSFLAREKYLFRDPFKGRHNIIGYFGGGIGGVFVAIASVCLNSLWIEVAEYHPNAKQSGLKKYKVVPVFFFCMTVVFLVLSQSLQRLNGNYKPNVIGFVFLPVTVSLIASQLVGASKLGKVIKLIADGKVPAATYRGLSLSKILYRVRTTAYLASAAIFFFMISALLFSCLDVIGSAKYGGNGWRDTVSPDTTFPLAKVLYMTKVLLLSVLCCVIAVHVHHDSTAAYNRNCKEINQEEADKDSSPTPDPTPAEDKNEEGLVPSL